MRLLPFLALLGCATAPPPEPAAEPTAAPVALAPRPFTAEQLRAHLPAGLVMRYLSEVAGQPTTIQVMRAVQADEKGVTLESTVYSEDEQPIGAPETSTETWEALVQHASFPQAATQLTKSQVTVPAGTFEGPLYVVAEPDGTQTRYYFAEDIPGPPVRLEKWKGDQRLMAWSLIFRSDRRP